MTDEGIGERLRRLREGRGLSQDRLAKAADISPGAVYLIEAGKRQRPEKATIEALSGALGVSQTYLMFGFEPTPGPGEWPPIELVLRQTSSLTEQDIAAVLSFIEGREALAREERLRAERDALLEALRRARGEESA